MNFLFMASMEKKKSEDKSICHPSTFPIIPLSSRNALKRSTPKNKGFINYVFCRNWVVRSPAGTRLDSSSLVKKITQSVDIQSPLKLLKTKRKKEKKDDHPRC